MYLGKLLKKIKTFYGTFMSTFKNYTDSIFLTITPKYMTKNNYTADIQSRMLTTLVITIIKITV